MRTSENESEKSATLTRRDHHHRSVWISVYVCVCVVNIQFMYDRIIITSRVFLTLVVGAIGVVVVVVTVDIVNYKCLSVLLLLLKQNMIAESISVSHITNQMNRVITQKFDRKMIFFPSDWVNYETEKGVYNVLNM